MGFLLARCRIAQMRTPLLLSLALLATSLFAAQDRTGAAIYTQDCARCHGPAGEGTKKAKQALVGEKSPAQLATVILKTMPDDEPGTCTPEDAKKVAAYISETFYSPDARAKLNPPRIELSRLTIHQYKNSVADVIASFGKAPKADARHGLHGEYYEGRGFGGRKPLIDRVDGEVQFDFGVSAPDGTKPSLIEVASNDKTPAGTAAPATAPDAKKNDAAKAQAAAKTDPSKAPSPAAKVDPATQKTPAVAVANPPAQNVGTAPPAKPAAAADAKNEPRKFNAKQFCVSWDGSIYAPETGNYEFTVKSDHAILLWINDLNAKRPLIDAVVRSGSDSQPLSGSIFLLAGRTYSFRLEFSKGRELDKKGLDDPKKVSKQASVQLFWKTPHGDMEIIPASVLSPVRSPEVLVIGTKFPPDDRSYGWERGTTISKEWNAATTDSAIEAADYVVTRLQSLSGTTLDAKDAKMKLQNFAKTFAERAFGRPLSDAEKTQFVDKQLDASPDLELALKRVILLTLKSPQFLYPGVLDGSAKTDGKAGSGYAVASRLALALWDSPPDQALLDAAAANKLSTHAEIAAQAERMLATPRAHVKIHEFLLTWLRVERFQELNKDQKRFPGFDPELVGDLRKSLELFVDSVVWSDASDFRQLLLSSDLFVNDRMAKFYNVSMPSASGGKNSTGLSEREFTKVKWDAEKRSGVLTHPYMLAGLAYPRESSPIHRGVFVVRGLLGTTLLPPPEAVVPLPPDLHPNMTTRDRVTMQTKPEACIRCHGVINPLGFTLENFDAVGRFRDVENTKPIDVSGSFELRDGSEVKFSGAKQMATMLAANEQVHAAFVQQFFQNLLKQPVRAYGLTLPQKLQESFAKSNFSIKKLAVEIALVAAEKPN